MEAVAFNDRSKGAGRMPGRRRRGLQQFSSFEQMAYGEAIDFYVVLDFERFHVGPSSVNAFTILVKS